jgi:hypothetical protein
MTAVSVASEYDIGVSFGHRPSGGYTGSGEVLEYDVSVSFESR